MYPNAKITGGGTPAPDWRTNLPDALKTKVPDGADGYIKDGDVIIFTKNGEALQNGKFNPDGSQYDPTKSDNANPEVRNPSGTTGSGNNGRTGNAGNGSSSSLFNMGFSNNTSGDLSAKFVNGNYDIDAQKFMGAAMGFGAMSSLAQMMPFGLGAVFANNAIGATLNNFMKSVSFNFDFKNFSTSANSNNSVSTDRTDDNEGATASSGTGEKTVADIAKDRGYTATDTDGVYQNNGKFFKYDEKTKEFVECNSDGSALGSTTQTTSTAESTPTASAPATTSASSGSHAKKSKGTSGASGTHKASSTASTKKTATTQKAKTNANANQVTQQDRNAFQTIMNGNLTNQSSIALAKAGVTKKDIADILKNSNNYSVVNDSTSLIVTNKANNQKRIFKFDAQGRVISVSNSNSNYGGGSSAQITYGQNNKVAKTTFVKSGDTSVETTFNSSGQTTSINEKVWRQNSSGGSWKTKSTTTFQKQSLGNSSKYIPKFDATTAGYSKTGNYAIVTTANGTWSQTQSPSQYTFRSKDNLNKYWVDAKTGNILQQVTYDKDGNIVKQKTLGKTVTNYDV